MIKRNWYYYSLKDHNLNLTKLSGSEKAEIVIVGGGISGLTTAYFLNKYGYKVTLVEKEFCGSGATGKSSGFVTPDSELQLANYTKSLGDTEAKNIWDFSWHGVHTIKELINTYSIDCQYVAQSAALISSNQSGIYDVQKEYITRSKAGYDVNLIQDNIKDIIGSDKYHNALIQPHCFGINGYLYCQELKHILLDKGVKIFEYSPAIDIYNNILNTPNGSITYDKIVLSVDKNLPEFNLATEEIYHALTFLMISKPLKDSDILKIFPKEPLMVSDTNLVFDYFRLTPDNRLLLGGAPLFASYSYCEYNQTCMDSYIAQAKDKLTEYFKSYFPDVKIEFEYIWPGLIGITKDLVPIAGNIDNIYYISGAAGLSWATALGKYTAEKIANPNNKSNFDNYFKVDRNYPINNTLTKILGKKISFALSNFLSARY